MDQGEMGNYAFQASSSPGAGVLWCLETGCDQIGFKEYDAILLTHTR